jgi:hypothetical protein
MAERRTLGTAMRLSPEKLAFIETGKQANNEPPSKPSLVIAEPELLKQLTPEPPVKVTKASAKPVNRRSRPEPKSQDTDLPHGGLRNLLVPLTTRLQPATFAALRRAALERRLNGLEPATVQEIIEEAIRNWLEVR